MLLAGSSGLALPFLSKIAARHNVALADLISLNRATIRNPNLIQVGQIVRIPGQDAASSTERGDAAAAGLEDAPAAG